MEDILSIYTQPYDPRFPLVCFDELPKTLTGKIRRIELREQARAASSD